MRPATALLLVIALFAPSLEGQPQDLEPERQVIADPDRLAGEIDALVQPYVHLGSFNGVVLIAQGKEVRFIKAYGKANYELEVANTTSTRFRVASLSKQFTNAAVGTALDRGLLTLGTTVAEYIPGFPNGDSITVEHLVSHTSGVPHTNEIDRLKDQTRFSLDAMVELLAGMPSDFAPGSDEKYSNGGYDLLAALIERASGSSFEDYLETAVFAPLGLEDSGRLHTYEVVPGLATGYVPGEAPGEHSQARFYAAEIRIGGGSMYSSAEDVFRLFRGTFQREFAALTAPELLFWDAGQRYEITGRSPGFVAKVFIDIPNDITVVSLANNYSAQAKWGQRLYQAAIGDPWATRDISPTRRLVADDLSRFYEGTFASRWDEGLIDVSPEGHLRYFDVENDWRVALVPLVGGRWMHPFFDTICSFRGEERAEAVLCQPALERLTESSRFERRESMRKE